MDYQKLQWLCLLIGFSFMLNCKIISGGSEISITNPMVNLTISETSVTKGAAGGSKISNGISKVNLTILESAVSKGAVCLDGTPPAYYYEEGSGEGANNWIIYLRGGEWCTNVTDCMERTKTERGSSSLAPKQREFYGILSNNKTFNPDFHNWNRVQVIYCDGASFTGDVEEVDPATNLHFRGARIFNAIAEHFMEKGMKHSKNAILTGGSAGGLAALLHCDGFRALFPNSTRVKCLIDGGYFLHNKLNKINYMEMVNEALINLHHSGKILPESCTAKMKPSLCLYPQYFIGEIKTPFFLVNSMYDTWQINKTLPGYYNTLMSNITCPLTLVNNLQGFKREFLFALPKQSHSSSMGMFIDSCLLHAHTMSDTYWNGLTIHHKTIAVAFADWYFDRSPVQLINQLHLPVNCYGFPSITNFCSSLKYPEI